MSAFLIQVSGKDIQAEARPEHIANTRGPRYCDEPLRHGEYFNGSPHWQHEGFGRHEAWLNIEPGDRGLLYCTGSVDEHGSCLSHLLTVEDVCLDETDGARLTFSAVEEFIPKVPYEDIQSEIEASRFSEDMELCGQQGFNITEISESDIERTLEITRRVRS